MRPEIVIDSGQLPTIGSGHKCDATDTLFRLTCDANDTCSEIICDATDTSSASGCISLFVQRDLSDQSGLWSAHRDKGLVLASFDTNAVDTLPWQATLP